MTKNQQEILYSEYNYTSDKEFAKHVLESVKDIPVLIDHQSSKPQKKKLTSILIILAIAIAAGFYAINLFIILMVINSFIIIDFILSIFKKSPTTLDKYLQNVTFNFEDYQRPSLSEVEKALQALYDWKKLQKSIPNDLQKIIDILDRLDLSLPAENYLDSLGAYDWKERFAARHGIARYGTGAIDLIGSPSHADDRDLKFWLLRSIAQKSVEIDNKRALCTKCFTRFSYFTHTFKSANHSKSRKLSFCGCRTCRQSKDYKYCDHVIATLNTQMAERYQIESNSINANWSIHRKTFDFNRVEILNATDKDVEQFCIQVGNDMDEIRQPRYKEMECVVKCQLDLNTIKILEDTFGKIIKY